MIVVEGKVKSKQRPRFNTRTGRAFTPKDTVSYENWIKINYQQQSNEYLEGFLKATVIIYFEIPKSYSKKRIQSIREGKEYPSTKKDIDNICKIVLDSLNGIAYKDDSQVVELVAYKRYTEGNERIEFEITEIR